MTIVAGLVHDGKVYMGADSLTTSNHGAASIEKTPKIFRVGDFLFGCAGSPRLKQIMHYAYSSPTSIIAEDDDAALTRYMVCTFIRDLQAFFDIQNFKDNFKEGEDQILIGFKGRLFGVYGAYDLEECEHNYNAIGSASDLALGSLYSTALSSMNPRDRIYFALEASAKHNVYVSKPFVFEEI